MMYSHDTFGLGHIRRTCLIAEYLSKTFTEINILIVSGSSMIHSMRFSSNIDYIKMPCLTKKSNSQYLPKYLKKHPEGVNQMRREIILNSLKVYEPDVFLVDKAPVGVMEELRDSLKYLREGMPGTKVILGLRDILDNPEHIRKTWKESGTYEVLDKHYDEIWIYGLQSMFDVIKEYAFPSSIVDKVHFCGYLERRGIRQTPEDIRAQLGMKDKKLVMLTLGGGGDGHYLVEVFIKAMSELSLQQKIGGLVITGPDFSYEKHDVCKAVTGVGKGIIIKDYTLDILDYMNASDLIVSMAGYNTICEILSLNKEAIAIPRIHPRTEQLIRATMFSEMGLLKMINPVELSTQVLKEAISGALSSPRKPFNHSDYVGFHGLENIEARMSALMNGSCPHSPSKSEQSKSSTVGTVLSPGREGEIE